MRTIFISFILLLSVQFLIAQEYQHKSVAILPFRLMSPEANYTIGMPKDSLLEEERIFSLNVQQAFYNSIAYDKERWTITVQDYHLTDSLLEKAGVDLLKVNFLDKRALAAFLKVDAIITGKLDYFRMARAARKMSAPISQLVVSLFDGATGEEFWSYRQGVRADMLIGNYFRLNQSVYDGFSKRFPYVR